MTGWRRKKKNKNRKTDRAKKREKKMRGGEERGRVCDWKKKTYREDCCSTFSLCTLAVTFSCVSVRFLIINMLQGYREKKKLRRRVKRQTGKKKKRHT